MIGGRFMAKRVDPGSSPPIQKTVAMTSLFQAHLAATPKKPLPKEVEVVKEQVAPAASSEPVPLSEENSPEKETIC